MIIGANIDYLKLSDRNVTDFVRSQAFQFIAPLKYSVPLNLGAMELYLQDEYKISLYDALVKIISTSHIEHGAENKFKIHVSEEPFNDDITISGLVRLITMGNRSVRGTNVLLNMFKYALSKL